MRTITGVVRQRQGWRWNAGMAEAMTSRTGAADLQHGSMLKIVNKFRVYLYCDVLCVTGRGRCSQVSDTNSPRVLVSATSN
jgi:hypothetical protein